MTGRYLLITNASGGDISNNRGAEGGWTTAPAIVGADSNYNNQAYWKLEPVGSNWYITNVKTGRYLFIYDTFVRPGVT